MEWIEPSRAIGVCSEDGSEIAEYLNGTILPIKYLYDPRSHSQMPTTVGSRIWFGDASTWRGFFKIISVTKEQETHGTTWRVEFDVSSWTSVQTRIRGLSGLIRRYGLGYWASSGYGVIPQKRDLRSSVGERWSLIERDFADRAHFCCAHCLKNRGSSDDYHIWESWFQHAFDIYGDRGKVGRREIDEAYSWLCDHPAWGRHWFSFQPYWYEEDYVDTLKTAARSNGVELTVIKPGIHSPNTVCVLLIITDIQFFRNTVSQVIEDRINDRYGGRERSILERDRVHLETHYQRAPQVEESFRRALKALWL